MKKHNLRTSEKTSIITKKRVLKTPFVNGADDGTKSELERYSKNLHIIKNMLLKVKSAEYNVLELKMQMINVA